MSSTDAKFVAGSDTYKVALYLRSILHELGLTQHQPTRIYQDNHVAIHMVNTQALDCQTCHIDLWHFALMQQDEAQHVTSYGGYQHEYQP